MVEFWARLDRQLCDIRQELLRHRMYALIGDLASLRVFMAAHVLAVWDFMSLLKTLQRRLTCVEVPWLPPGDRLAARLINEIVLGEETDEIAPGRYTSHFELYLEAMSQIGAETQPIRQFLSALRSGVPVAGALASSGTQESARQFVLSTLETCEAPTHAVAASFLLGREDLIPDMFSRIVSELDRSGTHCELFRLYLERHAELDKEHHAPRARLLLENLCGSDPLKWDDAAAAASVALVARKGLWDGVLSSLGG